MPRKRNEMVISENICRFLKMGEEEVSKKVLSVLKRQRLAVKYFKGIVAEDDGSVIILMEHGHIRWNPDKDHDQWVPSESFSERRSVFKTAYAFR